MPSTRIPSPARSQGVISTPRRFKPRRSRSVCSPAPNMSVRLSTLVTDSYKVSPMPNRQSVLTDETDIEIQPGRKSWWKRLDENSREIMDALDSRDVAEVKNVADEFDVEVLSQEKRNYTLDLPESSDGESISSIVIPQRKLFTQKDNNPQKKFSQLVNTRDNQKRKSQIELVKDIDVAPKNLFSQPKPRNKPIFPSGLLNISGNKTVNKTKEMPAPEVKTQVRTLFGNRPATKRKNMFADFIVSDSEDDIPDIQPKIFAFKKNVEEKRRESRNSQAQHHSPTSSIDLEMDEWKLLPSSTMMGNQLEDTTPVKRARLSKLSEVKESETMSTLNKTKQSNKSIEYKNKSKKKTEESLQQQDVVMEEDLNLSNSRITRNKSKLIQEASFIKANRSKASNTSKNIAMKDKSVASTKCSQNPENIKSNINDLNLEENNRKIQNTSMEANPDDVVNNDNEGDNDNEDFTLEYENDDENVEDAECNTRTNKKVENQNDTVTQLQNELDKTKEKEKSQKALNRSTKHNNTNKSFKNNKDVVDGDVTDKVIHKENDNTLNVSQHNKSSKINSTGNKGNKTMDSDNKVLSIKDKNVEDSGSNHKNKVAESNVQLNTEENDESGNGNQKENEDIGNESEEKSESTVSSEQADSEIQNETDGEENEEEEQSMEIDEEQNESSKENVSNNVQDENISETSDEDQKNEVSENQSDEGEEKVDESDVQNNEEISNEEHQTDISGKDISENKEADDDEQSEIEETANDDDKQSESEKNDEQIEDADQNEMQSEDNTSNNESPNITNEKGEQLEAVTSPEAVLHDKTNQVDSFTTQGRNTTTRKTKSILIKTLNIRPSLAPVRESTGFSDGTRDSSADNSGWDSHRTTRKTLRQTFGKDFTLRKSLRALVMEKSAKRNTNFMEKADLTEVNNTKAPQANSTELPHFESYEEEPMHVDETPEEVSEGREEYKEHEDSEEHANREEPDVHEDSEEHENHEELEENEDHEDHEVSEEIEEHEDHEVSEEDEEHEDNEVSEEVVEEHEDIEVSEEVEDRDELEEHEVTEEAEEHVDYEELENHKDHEDHEISKTTRQTTLELYLQKIKQENLERKRKIEEQVRNSIKTTQQYNPFKNVGNRPRKLVPRTKTIDKSKKKENNRFFHSLPAEVLEDMKYKPPKRFQPNNASWITKRLYKFLETKLEPKYDYKARVRAEKLVETIYNFTKDIRKHNVAPSHSVDLLKNEMARLDVVKTHFEFYEFFRGYMPREIRIKVIPDVVNNISLPKHGVFSEIKIIQ